MVLGNGTCDFAFAIGVPFTDAVGPVRIFADAVEMPGSPLFLDADILDGELTIAGGTVSGWVCNRQSLVTSYRVTLTDQDGNAVMSVSAAPDTKGRDPLFAPSRFTAPLPAACFGRAELCLTARVGGSVFARAIGSARLDGYLDSVTREACTGWLFSPDAPDRRFDIAVYRDGVQVGTGATRIVRHDVLGRYPGAGACGFDLALRHQSVQANSLEHISIRIAGTDRELFGGPFLVGSRAAAIDDAYGALQRAGDSTALRDAFADWLAHARGGGDQIRLKTRALARPASHTKRLSVVIPVYADVAATRTCIESVLRECRADTGSVIIVNDNPGDMAIAELVDSFQRHENVFVLRNARNEGFIASVNRGMDFARAGDVLLLNADTELFPGALQEMQRVLRAGPAIGTVTAMSNNATLFSYPHPTLAADRLDDASWADLAAVALRANAGATVDVPTAHGFCMLIRREVIDEIGLFDPAFGRGYAEENDFSLRASDRGWRHVVAGGALVLHEEARSFGAEKAALVAANLEILGRRFPEYAGRIDRFAKADPVRRLRWPLDLERLRRLFAGGRDMRLCITNWLDGGTLRAAQDIDAVVHATDTLTVRVTCGRDGMIVLTTDALRLRAVFAPSESDILFEALATLPLKRTIVHQLLGFDQDFVRRLDRFLTGRDSIFHVHDFYYACPRVTMIDATGTFCGGAAADRCVRCVEMDGPHAAHRMEAVTPAEHRSLFEGLLSRAARVIVPSGDAAERLGALLPSVNAVAVPHPQTETAFPIGVRRGTAQDICLLGAIGPHKGSHTLLALARYARINHPDMRFHVLGFTNIDLELEAVGNVSISGQYEPGDLPALIGDTGARMALFLHGWPETFSYTLTEAVSLGLIPIVPDIGAPAERVRQAGFGVVYPFPIEVPSVAATLVGIGNGTIAFSRDGGLPLNFDTAGAHERMRALYRRDQPVPPAVTIKPRRRKATLV